MLIPHVLTPFCKLQSKIKTRLMVKFNSNGHKRIGKMSFIDLAGSERGADVVDQNKQTR